MQWLSIMTFLYLSSLHNNFILHCYPLTFNIWQVCVLLRVPVNNKRSELLTRSLNNNKNIAPLTLDQVWVGLWRSLFSVPQNSNAPTMHLNTQFSDQHAHGRKCICYLNNVVQDRENENCVRLKLAKWLAPHCTGCRAQSLKNLLG